MHCDNIKLFLTNIFDIYVIFLNIKYFQRIQNNTYLMVRWLNAYEILEHETCKRTKRIER